MHLVGLGGRCYVAAPRPAPRLGPSPRWDNPDLLHTCGRICGQAGMSITTRAAAEELWSRVGAAVRQQLNESTWDVWFRGVRALDYDGRCLTLAVPNPMAADRIRGSYAGILDDATL